MGMNIQLQYDVRNGEVFCEWLAFITQWCAVMLYLFALCISILLVSTIYSQLHSKDFLSSFKNPKQVRVGMEVVVVSLIIFCPTLVLWVPFYHSTYGPNSVSCWLRTVDENCTALEFGLMDQMVFGFGVFEVLSVAIIVIFLSLAVQFCKYACQYQLTRRHHLKTLGQTLFFMSFMVMSALIETAGLLISVYGIITKKGLPLWFLAMYHIAIPFSQFVVPLGFLVYLYSNKKFQWKNIQKAAAKWRKSLKCKCKCACCKRVGSSSYTKSDPYQHFPRAVVVEQATAPPSTRVSAPSESFFDVEYTGGFTSISHPVVSSGYGSITDPP